MTQGTAESVFLDYSIRKLRQYTGRIRECVSLLSDDQIWFRGHDNANAIGNLLMHLAGNVRQWIVSAIGGRPEVRERDREFAARGDALSAELLGRLEARIDEAASVIASLPPERLLSTITVQGYSLTTLEAVYHVVEHFSQHTGQIIFACKMMTGKDLAFYSHLSGRSSAGGQTP